MQNLPTEIIYNILDNLNISDLISMKNTCTEYQDIILQDPNYAVIINEFHFSYKIFTNAYLLTYYLKHYSNHITESECNYAVSVLIAQSKFHLIDIIINKLNYKITWNDHLITATSQGNKEAILYCIFKGANNFTECCFIARLHGHIYLLELFIDKKSIITAFNEHRYDEFYSYMSK